MQIIKFSALAEDAGHPALELKGMSSPDQGLIAAFARSAAQANQHKSDQVAAVQDANLSDSAHLTQMLAESAEYNIRISLINAVVRKGVAAVETLVKS